MKPSTIKIPESACAKYPIIIKPPNNKLCYDIVFRGVLPKGFTINGLQQNGKWEVLHTVSATTKSNNVFLLEQAKGVKEVKIECVDHRSPNIYYQYR